MVWFLLGLLMNAAGLYLGFDNFLCFVLMFVGWFFCAFGLALFALRFFDDSKDKAATRLSPKFISVGSTGAMPAMRRSRGGQSDSPG